MNRVIQLKRAARTVVTNLAMRTAAVSSAASFAAVIAVVSCAAVLGGCKSQPMTPLEHGRLLYMTNCVICHNPDPNLAGTQGPPIAGSSRALVEARVLHLAYPPGYAPKRKTHSMRAFPAMTRKQIDDLTAFLDSAATPGR